MVAELPIRARELNADPRYNHVVTKLAVFGSFLSDKPVLGDVDIAYQRELRVSGPAKSEADERFATHFPPPDYIRADFVASLWWAEIKFVRDLRTGPGMRIHDFEELLLLACPYRVIFDVAEEV